MAYLLHLPWIVVGMAAMNSLRTDAERTRVLAWIATTLLGILGLHRARGVVPGFDALFSGIISVLADISDKPDLLMKDGDQALYGIALVALSVHLATVNGPHRRLIPFLAGLLLGTHLAKFSLGGSRGALLGALFGLLTLLVLAGWRSSPLRKALVGMAMGFLFTAGSILSSVELPTEGQPRSTALAPTIVERYEALSGRRSLTATTEQVRAEEGAWPRESEVSWRFDIWTEVVEEWNSTWRNRLFGIGFGNDIAAMTVPGRQGFDGLNRGVHSIAFTILPRQGLSGVLVAVILLGTIFIAPSPGRLLTIPVTLSALAVGLFDVFLEGVHAPVFLWTIVGLGLLRTVPQGASISWKSAK